MPEGDYFSLFSGLLEAFLFQREWSCDDKWGLPKLTGKSQVILSAFQRENTTLGVSRDRHNHLLPVYFHSTMHEIFKTYISQRDWYKSLFVEKDDLYLYFRSNWRYAFFSLIWSHCSNLQSPIIKNLGQQQCNTSWKANSLYQFHSVHVFLLHLSRYVFTL